MAFQPHFRSRPASHVQQQEAPAEGSAQNEDGQQAGKPTVVVVKQKSESMHHCKGCMWFAMFLAFHFLCFIATISMGLGVGIIALEMHELCWGTAMDPFWATYVMIIFVYAAVQLYAQLVFNTKFYKWGRKVQVKYRIELFLVPRILYVFLYVLAVGNLYFQYGGAHEVLHAAAASKPSNASVGKEKPSEVTTTGYWSGWGSERRSSNYTHFNLTTTTTSTITSTTAMTSTRPSPSNNSIEIKDAPIARLYDDAQHSTLFICSLAYMMYGITKENDWLTYRLITLNKGEPDPYHYGNLSNLMFLLLVHLATTLFYSLPLIGWSFMMYKFRTSAAVLYFTVCPIAASIGVFGSFLERRNPFPTEPMVAPTYAFENHLRVRMFLIHLWLIPLGAGRFFNSNWTIVLDSSNYDFVVFCVEIGIGVVQASKVIANDIFLIYNNWGFDDDSVHLLPTTVSTQTDFLTDAYGEFEDSNGGKTAQEAADLLKDILEVTIEEGVGEFIRQGRARSEIAPVVKPSYSSATATASNGSPRVEEPPPAPIPYGPIPSNVTLTPINDIPVEIPVIPEEDVNLISLTAPSSSSELPLPEKEQQQEPLPPPPKPKTEDDSSSDSEKPEPEF